MKLSLEQHMANFKKQHGEEEAVVTPDGRIVVPTWLAAMLLHLSGVKSKKKRILKKTLTKKMNDLLEKGLAAVKDAP